MKVMLETHFPDCQVLDEETLLRGSHLVSSSRDQGLDFGWTGSVW
jgi:hypothetical protein